jgi:hypothetical protein
VGGSFAIGDTEHEDTAMGNEVTCVARIDGKKVEGKAWLESSELIFRGADCRAKITFTRMKTVTAKQGELRIKSKDGMFAFAVGAAAEKWREKILHPKTRVEKLGVKAGVRVEMIGEPDADFAEELKQSKAVIADGNAKASAELLFWFVDGKTGLRGAVKLAKKLQGAAGLWIVYPKGRKEITENDVLSAGRKAGLKDVKVVGFSPTLTALKFVLPVEKR